jgi:cellulose synthase (UDP-forming)
MRIRVAKKDNEKYYYALDHKDASLVRLLGALGFVATVLVLFGYIQFLHVSSFLALFLAPVLLIVTLYYLIQDLLLVNYPGFDLARHKQKVAAYWKRTKQAPRVAVFIPAAGEDVNVVAATVKAASEIDYPNYAVAVLDDSKDALYQQIARKYKVGYVRRQNTGEGKKAGNMNHALGKIDGYDYILVLDADFQARPEILQELVPYAGRDVGVVQSPQHFPRNEEVHGRSKIEYGAAYIQSDFYRVTQVARNKFGAAICVGTDALYNVEALKRVGGYEGVGQPRGWAHSEDVYTGLKMLNSYNDYDERYQVRYVPIQLAKGSCPDTHQSFYKQQNRWATGSMQLIFSTMTVRSHKLSAMQRLIYGSNALYYFYTMAILLSPLYLLTLALSNYPVSWAFTLYFIPSLVVRYVLEPFVMRRELAPVATTLVVMSNAYTFLQALVLLAIRRPLGWEATGTKSSKKSGHFTYFKLMAVAFFLAMYILTLGVLIMNEHFEVGPSIFIVCMFLSAFLAHCSFLIYTLVVGSEKRNRLADRKLYATLAIFLITGATVFGALKYHAKYNIALTGGHIALEKQAPGAAHTDTPLDGYRRSVGDVKQLLGIK